MTEPHQSGRLRVLYIWDSEYPWDIRTQKICAALTERGHDVHLAARNRKWDLVTGRLPECTVHRMPPWSLLGRRLDAIASFPAFMNPRWLRLLHRLTGELRPDVIIVRDLPLCPTAHFAARRHRVPLVLDMAENYPEMMRDIWRAGRQRPWDLLVRNPRLVERVERYCLPRVDHVLAMVEESAERLRALGVPTERISIVSNTPPRDRATGPGRNGRAPDARLALVYLGLMEIPRGVHLAIEAVALLKRDARPAPRLVLIGDGRDRRDFERRARSLGLGEDDVTFLGFVPNREALEIVAESDVGLVPHVATESWNTTIPNKLFDYMAAGLPVISSDAKPCARILQETGAGLVFRSEDVTDLARCMSVMTSPQVRNELGNAGRRAVSERLNWEAAVDSLERALESVTTAASARA